MTWNFAYESCPPNSKIKGLIKRSRLAIIANITALHYNILIIPDMTGIVIAIKSVGNISIAF
jgi:hypothetical protein